MKNVPVKKISKLKGVNFRVINVLNVKNNTTKYGNKWCVIDGIKFQSIKEGGYYQFLKSELQHKKIKSFKRQVTFRIEINGVLVCRYIADFVVTYNDGSKKVIDVKGFKTDVYKLKKSLIFAVHNIKIIEV